MQVLYTAHATATGGRDGRATSSDKALDVALSTPQQLGGAGGFSLAVTLSVSTPGMDGAAAEAVAAKAHEVCPYSNATRGNIAVTILVNPTKI
jgi:osmotically inducible protein OsmC